MKNKIISFIIIFLLGITYSKSQSLIDTIITTSNDKIPCKISYVNNYSVFYKYQKSSNKKKLKDQIIPRVSVQKLIINSKNITVLEEKIDNEVNEYLLKSKLDKKLEPLLISSNDSRELSLLAVKEWEINYKEYYGISYALFLFSKTHKCKLAYVEEVSRKDSIIKLKVYLYDAPIDYYNSELSKFNNGKKYFIRTTDKKEKDIDQIKINDKKYTISKSEYLTINSDSIYSQNEYYIVVSKEADIKAYATTSSIGIMFIASSLNIKRISILEGELMLRYATKKDPINN